MKIEVSGIELKNRVSRIKSIFSKSNNQNFGKYIRLIISDCKIGIQAMNDRIAVYDEIRCFSDLEDTLTNSFLLDAETFIKFIEGHEQDLTIELFKDMEIKISYKTGSFSTVYWLDTNYPSFFYPENAPDFIIRSSNFVPSLKRAFKFTKLDEFRPEIETILLDISGDRVNIVSTDLQRLFVSSKFIEDDQIEKSIMLSYQAASILYESLADDDMDIRVYSDSVRTFLQFDTIILSDINLERSFVNYRIVTDRFVPCSKIVVNKDLFIKALTSVSTIESMIHVEVNNGVMKLRSEDMGERKKLIENIDVEVIEGEEECKFLTVSKNILPSLRVLSGDQITLEYSLAHRSFKMYGTNRAEYVINVVFSTI